MEEIEAGRELDKRVAREVFGLTIVSGAEANAEYKPRCLAQADQMEACTEIAEESRKNIARLLRLNAEQVTDFYAHDLYVRPETVTVYTDFSVVPGYSTDAVAALSVFEKVGSPKGWFLNRATDGTWAVVTLGQKPSFGMNPSPYARVEINCIATGDTPALAICRAALESLAVGAAHV